MLARLSSWAPPALLVLFLLVAYGRLTTLEGVVITDDVFISDLQNAELPWRAAAGRMLRGGELPLWSPEMCGGYPLLAGGGGTEPLALALFTVLPPRVALNLLMLLVLAIASLGAYAYARTIGATRAGALLAGLAFGSSGFMVCQLKHLGVVTTVCWFPLALCFLERALRAKGRGDEIAPLAARLRDLSGFALVFGLQIHAGFPQSAYISGLVYVLYAALRLPALLLARRPGLLLALGLAFGLACALAVGVGALQLIPQQELSGLSQRVGKLNLDQAAHVAFWPKNLSLFLSPYGNGDISNLTYKGPSVFWEDYGYVGLAPLVLGLFALYAGVVRGFRRWHTLAWILLGGLALLMVVSKATPAFALAHRYLPGMNIFRFPTRFMFVVDFALAILGALGLSRLQLVLGAWGERRAAAFKGAAVALAAGTVAFAAADLAHHQLRQNAIIDARRWFREPPTVAAIKRRSPASLHRVYTVGALDSHRAAFNRARGWSGDLDHYLRQRDYVQANANMLYELASPDCYAGLVPRWMRDVWGPLGLIVRTDPARRVGPFGRASFLHLLELWSVKHLIVPRALDLRPELVPVGAGHEVTVYELPRPLPRAYLVPGAHLARDRGDASARLLDPRFDLRARVVLEREAPGGVDAVPPPTRGGSARIESHRANEVVVRISGAGGYLVLADTFYPGWVAELDGRERLPVLRANLGQRAVRVPAGEHTVRFSFRSPAIRQGALVSLGSLLLLGLGGLVLPWWWRRSRRDPA
jgi:hypothetical protein